MAPDKGRKWRSIFATTNLPNVLSFCATQWKIHKKYDNSFKDMFHWSLFLSYSSQLTSCFFFITLFLSFPPLAALFFPVLKGTTCQVFFYLNVVRKSYIAHFRPSSNTFTHLVTCIFFLFVCFFGHTCENPVRRTLCFTTVFYSKAAV